MKITVSRTDILNSLGLNHLNSTIDLRVDSSVISETPAQTPVGVGYIPVAVFASLRNNDKIAAIKTLRTAWGCGLKEGKDVVESICENCKL